MTESIKERPILFSAPMVRALLDGCTLLQSLPTGTPTPSYRSAFQFLWDSVNGKGSWDRNPWVWVLEFKRIEP